MKNSLNKISEKITGGSLSRILTEEATKMSLIRPFIENVLGYDISNELEVVPEYVADIGIKKGEKVDYAILSDDKPIMIIECKHHAEKLSLHNSQLLRYFHVTPANIAILTNGIEYQFYSDIDNSNIMDQSPFFSINVSKLTDDLISTLSLFTKRNFNITKILESIPKLKYNANVKDYLISQFNQPSDDFVEFIAMQITNNQLNSYILRECKHALLSLSVEFNTKDPASLQKDGIITTDQELEGFAIIKNILGEIINPNRVTYEDFKTYFGVYLDEKLFCKFDFRKRVMYITFIGDKEKIKISSLNDINNYKEKIYNYLT